MMELALANRVLDLVQEAMAPHRLSPGRLMLGADEMQPLQSWQLQQNSPDSADSVDYKVTE